MVEEDVRRVANNVLERYAALERTTIVRTTFPYPLIWESGNISVNVRDKVFQVRFERRYRQEGDEKIVPGFHHYSGANNVEVPYDRLGRVAHSWAEIRFPMYVEADMMDAYRELLGWVQAVINRLLEVYRYTTGEFHVEAIPKNELRPFSVQNVKEDGTLENREKMVSGPIGGEWVRVARTEPIPAEAQRILRDGTNLPIERMLYLNARREALFENYRIAVVEAETAFETLVDRAITEHYRRQGRSGSDIENILRAGLKNLIEHHLSKCCKEAFEGTPQHTAWETDLYNLRNSVVHNGASVEDEQCQQALAAAEQAIKWIEDRATL